MNKLKIVILVSIAAAGLALLLATETFSQSMACGSRDRIAVELKNRYDEEVDAIGLANNGAVVEIYVSNKGTWTMLVTTHVACIALAGSNWHTLVRKFKDT